MSDVAKVGRTLSGLRIASRGILWLLYLVALLATKEEYGCTQSYKDNNGPFGPFGDVYPFELPCMSSTAIVVGFALLSPFMLFLLRDWDHKNERERLVLLFSSPLMLVVHITYWVFLDNSLVFWHSYYSNRMIQSIIFGFYTTIASVIILVYTFFCNLISVEKALERREG